MRQRKAADAEAAPKSCSLTPGYIGKDDFPRSLRPEIETPAGELQCPVTYAGRNSLARTRHGKACGRVEHALVILTRSWQSFHSRNSSVATAQRGNSPSNRRSGRSSCEFDRSTFFSG